MMVGAAPSYVARLVEVPERFVPDHQVILRLME
jgi:hypothetical protein